MISESAGRQMTLDSLFLEQFNVPDQWSQIFCLARGLNNNIWSIDSDALSIKVREMNEHK
jgi:hypothetical protein